MSKDTGRARLRICKLDHGGPHNSASVYGHGGSVRVCIRIRGTDSWIYDPAWEKADAPAEATR